jgi:hypothetical protein
MQRVPKAESAFRNGGRNNLVQFRNARVHIHQAMDELAREFLQRSRSAGRRRLLDDLPYIVDVSIMKGDQDRALVGEVLIQGPDTDSGRLRDAVRGNRLRPVAFHHKLDRLEHVVHGPP